MGSTQKSNIYQMVKTNKTGSRVTVSAQKGAEIASTAPQRGHGSIGASIQRTAAASMSPPIHQRSEAGHSVIPPSSLDYAHVSYPQSGPSFSGAAIPRGTENRSKSDTYRHSSLQRKIQQTQIPSPYAVQMRRSSSPPREESTRRKGESKSGRDNRYSIPEAKSSYRLSFVDQKDNTQMLQEEDPPSKVQFPQGVRVPRRTLVSPKDEGVQTDLIRKSVTAADIRSPRRPSSPEHASIRIYADSRTAQRRTPGQESETGHHSTIYAEPKALPKNKNVESSFKLSILKDLDGRQRVSMHTDPESIRKHSTYTEAKPSSKVLASSEVEANTKPPVRGDEVGRRVTINAEVQPAQSTQRVTSRAVFESPRKSFMFNSSEPVYKHRTQKPSESISIPPGPKLKYPEPSPNAPVHAKVELTPRPLPPRSLPRYGPECSWWALLNTEVEVPQSRTTTPDSEPKSPPPVDYSLSFFEMNSSPFCEDLMFQRERASPSPPPPPATPPPPLQSPKEPPCWAPLKEVPQVPKCTSKQSIQSFSELQANDIDDDAWVDVRH